MIPPDDVLLELPPEPPDDVELPPVELPPVEVLPPEVDELPPEVEVLPVLVEETTTLPPPPPLPPPKNPPKNPPPPNPPIGPPPTSTAPLLPPLLEGSCCKSGAGSGTAISASCCGAHTRLVSVRTILRMRLTVRGWARAITVRWTGCCFTCLTCLT